MSGLRFGPRCMSPLICNASNGNDICREWHVGDSFDTVTESLWATAKNSVDSRRLLFEFATLQQVLLYANELHRVRVYADHRGAIAYRYALGAHSKQWKLYSPGNCAYSLQQCFFARHHSRRCSFETEGNITESSADWNCTRDHDALQSIEIQLLNNIFTDRRSEVSSCLMQLYI